MLAEIWELGFRQVELGHGIRLSLLQGIAEFLRDHDLAITSLHNFCPLPLEVFHASPDCLQCTSSDPNERNRAQRHTFATIDQAVRFGAPYVVLHLGFAPMRDETNRLAKLIHQGKIFGRTFVQTKLRALRQREKADVYPRVRDWLVPVIEHAKQARVRLGIENRTELDTRNYSTILKSRFSATGTISVMPRSGKISRSTTMPNGCKRLLRDY
jgi:sugar phosphate isomerase/epimerase